MTVAHLAVYLRLRSERRDGVHDDDIHRPAPHQRLDDVERLLAVVGLGDVEVFELHPEPRGIGGIESVLGVYERSRAARLLHFGDDMQRDGGLARGFGSVDLDYPALGDAADAEGDVQSETARGHGFHLLDMFLAEAHYRAFPELFFDLRKRKFKRIALVVPVCHMLLLLLYNAL